MLIYARSRRQENEIPMRPAPSIMPHALGAPFRPGVQTLLLVALLACPAGGAAAAPVGERALHHVLRLAGEIGPRPTGREADRRAIDYIRDQMEQAGLHVTLQEVGSIPEDDGERRVASWNVIGRLPGDSPDLVVVGAHHDSAGGEIPGANDDASGVAVLLETARMTAARPRRLSYEFVSFCAEEAGRAGSRSFVRRIDPAGVRAMIALEMLGRGEILVGPVPGPPPLWAQRALLRAGWETRIDQVVARPLWTLVPRFVDLPHSSDHQAFLDRGIPAFLMLGTYPAWTYHTGEDRVVWIRPRALRRAVTVLNRLLLDLEAGAARPFPPPDTRYLPFTMFGRGWIVPTPALRAFVLATLAVAGLLILARWRVLVSRRRIGETLRVLIVGGAATAVGLCGPFLSGWLIRRIHGVRFPWAAHPAVHVTLALAATAVTGWVGLNLFRRIKPTIDPGPYFAAALLLPLGGAVFLMARGWIDLAALAVVPAAGFLLSRLVESTGRKLALGMLAMLPLAAVLSLRDLRAAIDLGGLAPEPRVLFAALLLLTLPFVLFVAHVASFQNCLHSRFWWWLSGRWVGGLALAAWVGLAVAAALLSPYDAAHRQLVRVRQSVDLQTGRATVMLQSADTLRGVRVAGRSTPLPDDSGTTERVTAAPPGDRLELDAGAETVAAPEGLAVTCSARLRAPEPPDSISYLFTSRSGFRVPSRDETLRHRYVVIDEAARNDGAPLLQLLLPDDGDLAVSMRAEFGSDLLGIGAVGGPRVFQYQATVTGTRRLVGHPETPGAPPAETGPAPGARSAAPSGATPGAPR
jgi:Peptidase family M28